MLFCLDLFSGIGGFSLGLEATGGFQTVAFCENDLFCQKVLAKHWPDVPIYDDVRGENVKRVKADVITGGFPCQPFSQAGKRRGAEDDRYLWPKMLEVIQAVRPSWVIAENVRGFVRLALDGVLSDLEAAGYSVWTCIVPAAGVGAPHLRERVWIVGSWDALAYPLSNGLRDGGQRGGEQYEQSGETESQDDVKVGFVPDSGNQKQFAVAEYAEVAGASGSVAHSNSLGCDGRAGQSGQERGSETPRFVTNTMFYGLQGSEQGGAEERSTIRDSDWPLVESPVCGANDGISCRLDRIRALGNAVVPQIVTEIGRAILAAEEGK